MQMKLPLSLRVSLLLIKTTIAGKIVIILVQSQINSSLQCNDNSYPHTGISSDIESHQVTLEFGRTFKRDEKIQLRLEFKGILNDEMAGFYRSSYKTENGDTK
jgi:aminopeptidase 2